MTRQDDALLNTQNPLLLRAAVNGGAPMLFQDMDSNFFSVLRWGGSYDPANPRRYTQSEVVRDGDWTMVALRDTDERPGIQTSGPPIWDLPDLPPFVERSFSGVVWSGTEYLLTQPGFVNAIQIWAPELTADTNYRIILTDNTDPANPRVMFVSEPVLNENAWTTIALSPTPYSAGSNLSVVVDVLNSGSDTTVTGGWNRAVNVNDPTTDPGLSAWGTQNSVASIRVSKTDLDSTDRSTELLGITAGATMTFADTVDGNQSMRWTINADPVDQGTHISWANVTYDGPGVGGEPPIGNPCTLTALVPVPAPTKYVDAVDYWLTNQPTWANVSGLLRLGGVDQVVPNNAYGVRIQFQPAYVPIDWDVFDYSG